MSLRICPVHGSYVADASTDFGETWCPECRPRPHVSAEGKVTLELDAHEAWKVYDLVAARTESLDAAEIETRSNCGGEPWRLLRRKIRHRLPASREGSPL